jgi:putative SOS response-associated peptidase YedK
MMAPIHDRMPVLIPEEAWERWLDPSRTDGEALAELKGLLVPTPEGELELYPVSRRVNDVRNDGPDLIERIPESAVAGGPDAAPTHDPIQPGLFEDDPPKA